jgi:CubicO group peptidase (beta-lactamase class C family)
MKMLAMLVALTISLAGCSPADQPAAESSKYAATAAADNAYEKKYSDQMGTAPFAAKNMTDATVNAEDGAVYANRHVPEYATVAWNIAPSSDPLIFKEAIQPLSDADIEFLASTNTDGFIAVKGDTIVQEYYATGMHPTTRHATYSVGKSWTSAYFHDVLLDVMDKRVEEVLPEFEGTIYGAELIRSLADMRSPILWGSDYTDPQSEVMISGSSTGWDYKSSELEQKAFIKLLKRDPHYESGDWHYVDSNPMVMALIGTKLSGRHPYESIRQLHHALGFEHISGTIANLHNQYSGEGGHYMTLRDLVKLPYAMANDGHVNDRKVISDAYIEDVFTADDAKQAAWKASPYDDHYKVVNWYSNQWYAVDDDIAMGIGSYGQFIVFDRKNRVAVAMFSTYQVGQDVHSAGRDVPWLIEKVRNLR